MDKRTICLLNDSFPPEIDGVANAVVNYAKNITKSGENAIVVTPTMPGADDILQKLLLLYFECYNHLHMVYLVNHYSNNNLD